MKGKDIASIVKTALSLFLICAVAAAALAYVNSVTAPTIAVNNAVAADKARKELLPEADSFEAGSTSVNVYSRTEETEEKLEVWSYDKMYLYFIGKRGGETVGYVFTTSAKGYGGDVEIMTGIDTEGKVTGISILTINETPGLGMNAKKDDFKNQFKGKSGELAVNKDGGEIVAITSATVTSRAVTKAVNEALSLYEKVTTGEGA